MTALFWSQIFDTVVRWLPIAFFVGAPLLLIAIVAAALVDAKATRK